MPNLNLDKGSRMCVLYPAIREAVRGIKDAEIENFKNCIHHLVGKTDNESIRVRSKCYDRREDKLVDLQTLLNWALPAGINAGFSGEHVEARLNALMQSVELASYWEGKCQGAPDDFEACHHFQTLFDQVREDLQPLRTWAVAADALMSSQNTKPVADAAHSPDFRSVNWFGTEYSFTANQAACVKALWDAWDKGTPDVGQVTLQTEADIESQPRHLFRKNAAWGNMIVRGNTKGTLRLRPSGEE
jgi:hypothetical protein